MRVPLLAALIIHPAHKAMQGVEAVMWETSLDGDGVADVDNALDACAGEGVA